VHYADSERLQGYRGGHLSAGQVNRLDDFGRDGREHFGDVHKIGQRFQNALDRVGKFLILPMGRRYLLPIDCFSRRGSDLFLHPVHVAETFDFGFIFGRQAKLLFRHVVEIATSRRRADAPRIVGDHFGNALNRQRLMPAMVLRRAKAATVGTCAHARAPRSLILELVRLTGARDALAIFMLPVVAALWARRLDDDISALDWSAHDAYLTLNPPVGGLP
jgi:hypothetical protein